MRLLREYTGGADFLDVSSDGRRLCIEFVPGGLTTRVDVIELGSWRVIYSHKFTSRLPLRAGFFKGGESLYVSALDPDTIFWIDVASGGARETSPPIPGVTGYMPLENGVLLATAADGSMLRVGLPGYDILRRGPKASGLVSSDRQRMVSVSGRDERVLECYRTTDLALVWTDRLTIPGAKWDPLHNFRGSASVAISADGRTVAFAANDNVFLNDVKEFFVAIIDGDAGAERARLNVNGIPVMAVSPDGEFLATGRSTFAKKATDLIVEIRSIRSGEVVTTLTHLSLGPAEPRNTANFSFLGRGVNFTPDGKYLVTAGANSVKVWGWS